MTTHKAELVALRGEGELTEFRSPTGCDGYPHTCEPVVANGQPYLVLVWRVTPPPIPETPPRTKKGKP